MWPYLQIARDLFGNHKHLLLHNISNCLEVNTNFLVINQSRLSSHSNTDLKLNILLLAKSTFLRVRIVRRVFSSTSHKMEPSAPATTQCACRSRSLARAEDWSTFGHNPTAICDAIIANLALTGQDTKIERLWQKNNLSSYPANIKFPKAQLI